MNHNVRRIQPRASIVAERSEARYPFRKQTLDLSSVGLKTAKKSQKFLVRTTSGDDVITTDKTSKAYAAFMCQYIKKRE